MSKQSEAVKKWRKTTKRKLVLGFGGKCGLCGYDRCDESLDFHHIDPSKKEFSFGSIRASCKNWNAIVDEIQKCVMVCSNCHREIHAGLIGHIHIESLPKFDINNAELSVLSNRGNGIYYCSCGKERKKHAEFCSKECYNIDRRKFDWSSVDLIEMSKTKSNCQIAKECGVSEATIRKRIKTLLKQEHLELL